MSLDLLDAPLRLTWDLHGADGAPAPQGLLPRVAAEVTRMGVFFLTLQARPLLHPSIGPLLARLAAGGSRIAVVCEGSAAELEVLASAPAAGILFLDVTPSLAAAGRLDRTALRRTVEELRQTGFEPALMMTPGRRTLPLLADLLAFCREAGIGKIKLPNTPIGDSFLPSAADWMRPEDLEDFRRLAGSDPLALHAGLALEIHDLFLWEILFPGREEGRSEYGGCQAGNSLAHVDAAGNLYPCSSWPERLGSLLDHSLGELWQSPRRLQLRQEIAVVPTGCAGCRDYIACLGGCRGAGRILNHGAGDRDPLCPGPRGIGGKS